MKLGLTDKIALVTGASQGLGFAAAKALASEGARVAICSRSKESLQRAATEIEAATGTTPWWNCADLTRPKEITRLVVAVRAELGAPQILVNNTGGPPPGRFDDIDDEQWEASFRLTALSTIRTVREVSPLMKSAGFGRIINIQSRSVREPIDGLLTSSVIRPGVIGLAKSLSQELGPHGVTVNTVLPGFIRTERLHALARDRAEREGTTPQAVLEAWGQENPMKRIGEPHEVGSLVAFLASERAAFINGVSLLIDGGGVRSLF